MGGKDKLPYFFCIDGLLRVRELGEISHSGHVCVVSAKQSQKSDASSYPVIQGKQKKNNKQGDISMSPFFFSNRPLALEMKLCGEIHSEYFWVQLNIL